MFKYRSYQREADEAIWNYFRNGGTGNPIVAMPTGTGKSIVIGGFVQGVMHSFPSQRIMMLTHVKELIEQNFEKLIKMWPSSPAGIYSAGIGRRDIHQPITYAGIQSVAKKPELFGHIDLIIIDECHLVSPDMTTSYAKFIAALTEVNPYLKVIGFSATPYRLGLGLLTDGNLFTDICCDQTSMHKFNWFIEEGYLIPLYPKSTGEKLSTEGIRVQGGEFNLRDLQQATDKTEITYRAVQEMIERGYDRRKWLIFATGVEHSIHIAQMLQQFGIPAAAVHNNLTKEERKNILRAYRLGELRAIVNNNILTTGFDEPDIDMIAVLRQTMSPGLWVQMLGRGTRPVYAPGNYDLETTQGRLEAIAASHKQDCLVLDFAGNTLRLGPINDPVLPRRKRKTGQPAPIRECPECGMLCHTSVRICPDCRYEFPMTVKFSDKAGTADLVKKDDPIVEIFPVDKITYTKHLKRQHPDTLKVAYHCGLRRFVKYICLEHEGKAGGYAKRWWKEAAGNSDYPATIDNALLLVDDLRIPKSIKVWVNKKPHTEILSIDYE